MTPPKVRILCTHRDEETLNRLTAALGEICGGSISIEALPDGEAIAQALAGPERAAWGDIAMIFSDFGGQGTGTAPFLKGLRHNRLRRIRRVYFGEASSGEPLDGLLQQGAVHARLDPGFSQAELRALLRDHLTDFVVSAPELIELLDPLLDSDRIRQHFEESPFTTGIPHSLIEDTPPADAKIEDGMVGEFDRILGTPQRKTYEPGDDLVREGDDAGRIWIILAGQVKLVRIVEEEEVIFHSTSAGKIVGLMSLSLQNPVFFTVRAISPVTAIVLDRSEVRRALHESPLLAHYLITVIMRSMARRNVRAAELLMEVRTLNNQIGRQRDELARTLRELRATQNQLVETTKMATLGNLAAGIAHELNNPVGAMLRSAEHLETDILALIDRCHGSLAGPRAIQEVRSIPPLTTREERHFRKELEEKLQITKQQAASLILAGVHSPERFLEITGLRRPPRGRELTELITEISLAGQIGVALRNLTNCANRVSGLVKSLRLYSREEPDALEPVNINETLVDTLCILAGPLRAIEVERDFGELPLVPGNASQLQQVWTNLLTNAAQVMEGEGKISIRTSRIENDGVRVEIEDSGPGIPDEIQDKVWDLRFTSRSGRVEFGLGMGLTITKTIVTKHGGDISFQSSPNGTIFTVELPGSEKSDEP